MTEDRTRTRRATVDVPRRPSPRDAGAVRDIIAAVLKAEHTGAEAPFPAAPCVCRHGQDGHTGASNHGRCQHDGCRCVKYRADMLHVMADQILASRAATLADDIAAFNRHEASKRPPRQPIPEGEWLVYASDLGGCGRRIAYRNGLAGDVDRDWSDRGAREAGNMIEEFKRRVRAWRYPWLLFQVELDIEGLSRKGKADEIDPYLGIVSDDKSKGEGAWRKLGDAGPSKADFGQVCLYAAAWEAAGNPVTAVRIVYINRGDLSVEVFERPWDDIRRAWAEEARAELRARQVQLDVAAATGELPPRDFEGPSLSFVCRSCEFRSTCWDLQRAGELNRSPEGLDRFGPTPEDAEVDQTLGEVHEAYQARREANARVDALRVLLDGLPPRAYGDYRIVPGRAGSPLWSQYAEALVAFGEAHGVDFSEVEVPMGRPSAVSVRPVRAATREARAAAAAEATGTAEGAA